jgi:hypothetical protein
MAKAKFWILHCPEFEITPTRQRPGFEGDVSVAAPPIGGAAVACSGFEESAWYIADNVPWNKSLLSPTSSFYSLNKFSSFSVFLVFPGNS